MYCKQEKTKIKPKNVQWLVLLNFSYLELYLKLNVPRDLNFNCTTADSCEVAFTYFLIWCAIAKVFLYQ